MFIVVISMIIIFFLGFRFIDEICSIAIPSENSTDFAKFENTLIHGNKPDLDSSLFTSFNDRGKSDVHN